MTRVSKTIDKADAVNPKREWPAELPRATQSEINDFVRGVVGGSVYVALDDRDLEWCFLPLTLGGLVDAPQSYLDSIGVTYEFKALAGPVAINGRPMFTSVRFLHKKDFAIARKRIAKIMKELA